jgi:signal peptidase I
MKRRVWTAVLCRVYAILLYAYPKEFRVQFGAEMRQIFLDRWGAVSATPRLAPLMLFFFKMTKDWILSSSVERMASMRMTFLSNRLRRTAQRLCVAVVTVLVCFFVSTTFLQAFVIRGASMEASLLVGDHILVNKLGHGREIRRGDLVSFRYPEDRRVILVKRVIGLPGDHIRILDKQVIRNGRPIAEPYALHRMPNTEPFRDNFPASPPANTTQRGLDMLAHNVVHDEVIVPAGSLFVLGDNRDNSLDSRYWGFLPRVDVVGKPLLVYYPRLHALQGGQVEP